MYPLESAAFFSPTSVSSALQGKTLRTLVEEGEDDEDGVSSALAAAVVLGREASEARGVSTPA